MYVPVLGRHRKYGDLEFNGRYLGTYDPEAEQNSILD